MITVECAVEAGKWPDIGICQSMANRAVSAAAERLSSNIPSGAEVSVLFIDDKQMQMLNSQWRGQDKPTNVLSFAANEGDGPAMPLLGDIVLAYETIEREASEQGKSFNDHLSHLVIHGFFHLLGFDHLEDGEAEVMENLERAACSALGIADPYAEH